MRRRDFIKGVGGTAAFWPLAARAQQPLPVIGFLNSRSPAEAETVVPAFRQGLSQTGFVQGQNVAIEYRWAEGHFDRLPALAADLVRRQVAVIVAAGGTVAVLAAKGATTTTPIVFVTGDDPVKIGIVVSLNRPGGNITGTSLYSTALDPKRMELLRELVPKGTTIAFLLNPSNPNAGPERKDLEEAARTVGQKIIVVNAASERDFAPTFANLVQQRVNALLVANDPYFVIQRDRLVALAASHGVATIYPYREFAAAGGLISYGTSLAEAYRKVGIYTGQILKGAKPADLPVQLPTKFELVVNLKTSKKLGLDLPASILLRADEVIE